MQKTILPTSILELARHRGATQDDDGSMSLAEFDRVGLPLFGGCEVCGASIAAYNAYPTQSGYLRCADCVGSTGFVTATLANDELFGPEEGNGADA